MYVPEGVKLGVVHHDLLLPLDLLRLLPLLLLLRPRPLQRPLHHVGRVSRIFLRASPKVKVQVTVGGTKLHPTMKQMNKKNNKSNETKNTVK